MLFPFKQLKSVCQRNYTLYQEVKAENDDQDGLCVFLQPVSKSVHEILRAFPQN